MNTPPTSSASLQKSLAVYYPDEQHKINSSDDDKEHNPGQTECKHKMYDRLDETQTFVGANGFVSFTQTFRYLGLLISYNLQDDDNITARIAAANASMGALKEVWRNPPRCVLQISPLQSHPNEPTLVGCRNLVTTKITTQQIRSVSPPQHLTHPPNLNDNCAGTTATQ
jgi:hypothetical protein